MTAADILHARGKAEGRVEGKAEILLRQLVLKFGIVPDATRERIRKATSDELDVWIDPHRHGLGPRRSDVTAQA